MSTETETRTAPDELPTVEAVRFSFATMARQIGEGTCDPYTLAARAAELYERALWPGMAGLRRLLASYLHGADCTCPYSVDPADLARADAVLNAATATPAAETDIERAAAKALYDDPDIEVGREGIGGFCAGQAEATVLVLRRAGFRLIRETAEPG